MPNNIKITIKAAEVVIANFLEIPDYPKDKASGYLAERRKKDGRVLFVTQVGECPLGKIHRYFHFSLEKGERLFQFFHSRGDVSSWQSKSNEEEKYPGAIIAGESILSFSGLPALADEALSLIIALRRNMMTSQQASDIAHLSSNPYFLKKT